MVKIITDSASDFEPNELKKLMIDCIPLSVNFGDEEHKDNVTISKDEFFDKQKIQRKPSKLHNRHCMI